MKSKLAVVELFTVSLALSGSLAYAQGPVELPRPMQKRPSGSAELPMRPGGKTQAISVKDCVAVGGTIKLDTIGGCAHGTRCEGSRPGGGSYSLCITSLD